MSPRFTSSSAIAPAASDVAKVRSKTAMLRRPVRLKKLTEVQKTGTIKRWPLDRHAASTALQAPCTSRVPMRSQAGRGIEHLHRVAAFASRGREAFTVDLSPSQARFRATR